MTDNQLFTEERAAYFPMSLPNQVIGKCVPMSHYFEVEDTLEPLVFPANVNVDRWFKLPSDRRDAKHRLLTLQRATHQETIVFYDGEQAIGYSSGRMTSASEFMMNDTGILPDYQGKGIYSAFLKQYVTFLHDCGYERIVSYHSPTNSAILIAKLKAGFNIAGMELREHGGASVKLVYFTHQDRFEAFENVHSLESPTRSNKHD